MYKINKKFLKRSHFLFIIYYVTKFYRKRWIKTVEKMGRVVLYYRHGVGLDMNFYELGKEG